MEIDFHFSLTYVVSRLAGLRHEDANIVATCSQYVDDTVNSGVVKFKTGESFYRMSTAHKKLDYHIALPTEDRKVWVPFHFLPGNSSEGPDASEFYNRVVCKPNSEVAQAMLKNCILQKERAFGLHQLGITAHVYIDTWAHQEFAGVDHPINMAKDIVLEDPKDSDNFFKVCWREGLLAAVLYVFQPYFLRILNRLFPMGHGSVLHYPDHPFRIWSYTNGHGRRVHRNNPKDFLEAADELYKFICRFRMKDPGAIVSSIPEADRILISHLIKSLTDEDGEKRNKVWLKKIAEGAFSFGASDLSYESHGPKSWKCEALGTRRAHLSRYEKFDFQPHFLNSNWKLFHDAAQAHQFEILREILPQFGICAV